MKAIPPSHQGFDGVLFAPSNASEANNGAFRPTGITMLDAPEAIDGEAGDHTMSMPSMTNSGQKRAVPINDPIK